MMMIQPSAAWITLIFTYYCSHVNSLLSPSFFPSVHHRSYHSHIINYHTHDVVVSLLSPPVPQPSLSLFSITTTGTSEAGEGLNDDSNHESVSTITSAISSVSFTDLGISSPILLSAIQQRTDWEHPTSIQGLAIPVLLQQPTPQQLPQTRNVSTIPSTTTTRAVWCEAPTGDGKTACYLLPLIQNLLEQKKKQKSSISSSRSKVRSLILCPTRELVVQIGAVIEELLDSQNRNSNKPLLNVLLLYGGTIRETQIRAIANSIIPQQQDQQSTIDIIIATPGRLIDVIQQYNIVDDTTEDEDDDDFDMDVDDDDDDEVDDEMKSSLERRQPLSSADAAFERRILDALDNPSILNPDTSRNNRIGQRKGKKKQKRPTKSSLDKSLSLQQLQALGLLDGTSPGRQNDDGRGGIIDVLNELQYIIFDEADRLLSRTFEKDMEQVLQFVVPSTKKQQEPKHHVIPNTWLFSATFPKSIEPAVDNLIKRISRYNGSIQKNVKNDGDEMMKAMVVPSLLLPPECIRISCLNSDRTLQHSDDMSSTLLRKLERNNVLIPSQPNIVQIGSASTITLRTIRLEKRDRTAVLKKLLSEHASSWDRILVFVATRYAAEHVSRKLRRYNIVSSELHGKLDQDARTRRLQDLANGKIRVLIATDVASRGLDIVGLPVVINYDLPRSPADFVHRVGRTGRAGRFGTAITFVTPDNESHYNLIEQRYIPKENSATLVRETIPGYEPNEETWRIQADSSKYTVPGTVSSAKGLAHDRMYGGIKGHRKSKKDKLREMQQQQQQE